MHLAVDNAEQELIKWCLDYGFTTRTCNNRGMNCMHIAARRGDYKIAVQILEQAREEDEDIMRSFAEVPNCDRSTPLYIAAKFGNVKIMEMLLNK